MDNKKTIINPCVDVIIPTYNRALFIKESILSVLNQSYSNLKCYVIDDASSDETEKEVKSIEDNRLFYYKNSERRGANYSRNKGVHLSDSPLIAFNDSDDLWEPEKLNIQIEYWKNKGEGLYFSPYILVDNKKESLIGEVLDFNNIDVFKTLLNGNFIGTPTILVNRELFLKVGCFDENLERLQDWELCLRIANSHNLYYTKKPLVRARRVDNSITGNKINAIKTFFKIASNYKEKIKEDNIYIFLRNCLGSNLGIEDIIYILEQGLSLSKNDINSLLMDYFQYNNSIINKNRLYISLIYNLHKKKQKVISWIKRNNIKNISIYGNSELGNILCDVCMENDINVVVIVDRDEKKKSDYKTCIKEEFLQEYIQKVDALINTVPSLDSSLKEIKEVIVVENLTELIS